MKKGFCITCLECNEMMTLNEDYKKEDDDSKLTTSVMGNYPFQSLYLVCSNCGNELEIEV